MEAQITTSPLSVLWVGDAFGGSDHGALHKAAHRLILTLPETDFTFWYLTEEQNPISRIYGDSFRTIVGRSPDRIAAILGYTDLVRGVSPEQFAETAEALIREIAAKCHRNALFCSPPPLAFAGNPERMVAAEAYEQILERLSLESGLFHLRLSTPFTALIGAQSDHQGTIYALHKGDGTLTPFGQMYLADLLIDSPLFGDLVPLSHRPFPENESR